MQQQRHIHGRNRSSSRGSSRSRDERLQDTQSGSLGRTRRSPDAAIADRTAASNAAAVCATLPLRACATTFNGNANNETVFGSTGADCLNGNAGNDVLHGAAGDDLLFGGAGDDLLHGGTGNDYLWGDEGINTYLFHTGDGQDTIGSMADVPRNQYGILQFGHDVLPQHLLLSRCDCNLVIAIAGGSDRVTVEHFFHNNNPATNRVNPLHEVRFGNRARWDLATLMAMVLAGNEQAQTLLGYDTDDTIAAGAGDDSVWGLQGNDTLSGMQGDDTLHGGNGDDVLHGGSGDDQLYGDAGNDSLFGDAGDDQLYGGAGNDVLDGGRGNNVYYFGHDDGMDTIAAVVDATPGKRNAISFASDVSPSDVRISRVGTDLVLHIGSGGDAVTASMFFFGTDPATCVFNPVQEVRFWDGSIWDMATLKARVLVGNDQAQQLSGYDSDDTIAAGGGDDTVRGHAGNDTLMGGAGADHLYGNNGDDILHGGTDNDYLVGGSGNDTLYGGTGRDYLTGGSGNDTYRFARGDGHDTLSDFDTVGNNADVLQFGSTISRQHLWFSRDQNHLSIRLLGTNDQVSITNWYLGPAFRIEEIKTGDGGTLQASDVGQLVQAMAAFGVAAASHTRWTEGRHSDGRVLIASSH